MVLRWNFQDCTQHFCSNFHNPWFATLTDFELGIINACKDVYPSVPIACCYFHLGLWLYGRVQEAGLQAAYNDPDDRTVKASTHMILSLSFVPVDDVENVFDKL